MSFVYWAAIKMRSDGTTINFDKCTGAKLGGAGAYTVTLDNPLHPDECQPIPVPWVEVGGLLVPSAIVPTIDAPGTVITLNIFSIEDPPALLDSGFSLTVFRFQPGP
jgi:hypothetical protein